MTDEQLFDSAALTAAFKRVFVETYGVTTVDSKVTFRQDGYDVEHYLRGNEFHTACQVKNMAPEQLIEAVRLQVEAELNLHLIDAPASVRH